jgi:predicted membrane protein
MEVHIDFSSISLIIVRLFKLSFILFYVFVISNLFIYTTFLLIIIFIYFNLSIILFMQPTAPPNSKKRRRNEISNAEVRVQADPFLHMTREQHR